MTRDLQYATGGKETKHRDLLRVRCCGCGQQLDRKKGLKVASRLTCLVSCAGKGDAGTGAGAQNQQNRKSSRMMPDTPQVCGKETDVQGVPLAAIREAGVRAESLLCDKLDWARGLQAVRICQVGIS